MRIRLRWFEFAKWGIGIFLIIAIGILMWLFIGAVVDVFFFNGSKIYFWMLVFSIASFLAGMVIRGIFSINTDVEVWSMGDHELAGRIGELQDEQEKRKRGNGKR